MQLFARARNSPPQKFTPTSPPRHDHRMISQLDYCSPFGLLSISFCSFSPFQQRILCSAFPPSRTRQPEAQGFLAVIELSNCKFPHLRAPPTAQSPSALLWIKRSKAKIPNTKETAPKLQNLAIPALRLQRKVPEETSTTAQAERPPTTRCAKEHPGISFTSSPIFR